MEEPKKSDSGHSALDEIHGILKNQKFMADLICNSLKVGVLFLDTQTNQPVYTNRYIDKLPSSHWQFILNQIRYTIIHHWKDFQYPLLNQKISQGEIGDRFSYVFDLYPLKDKVVLISLKELKSALIFEHTQMENRLYNRFAELLAEIAHEVGNPLAGISALLQVSVRNYESWPREKIRDYINKAVHEIDRLTVILNRIRDVSMMDELNIAPVSISELIEHFWERNRDRIEQRKINFSYDVPKDLTAKLDGEAFYQIIVNLLNNSLRILKPHQHIRIYVEHRDNYFVKMVYYNDGKNIPESDLERIFSPFFTTSGIQGHGIGLALSLKLMIRMGGTIKAVKPEDNIGAKFVIYIPQ